MGSTPEVADSLHGFHDIIGPSSLSNPGMMCSYTASVEDGLALLIHGSPISDGLQEEEEGGSGGLHLLDYESENDGQNEGATTPHEGQSDYQVQHRSMQRWTLNLHEKLALTVHHKWIVFRNLMPFTISVGQQEPLCINIH
jgi:hypothetical protein